jgi:lipoyl(octanoyl) transferase
MRPLPLVKNLGLVDYDATWRAMQALNRSRAPDARDELWLLQHPPVFTLGLAGKPEHVLAPGNIAVVKIDRGGQVTYHGPGQLVLYLLLDLTALGYGVKELVKRIEQSVIDLLAEYRINSYRLAGMPGVYTKAAVTAQAGSVAAGPWAGHAKIAAIGLRVANHATYHGLSLNIDMDLEPFSRINPCGYEGLAVTQMREFGVTDNMDTIGEKLVAHLQVNLYPDLP